MNGTSQQKIVADSIIINSRIATMDERWSFAHAVAIRDGRFIAVGNDQEIMAFKGKETKVIDAGGRTAIPGLNDSHIHMIRGGLNCNLELRWDGVPSLADALRMLRDQARLTPPPPVGARCRRVVGVSICRTPHANA